MAHEQARPSSKTNLSGGGLLLLHGGRAHPAANWLEVRPPPPPRTMAQWAVPGWLTPESRSSANCLIYGLALAPATTSRLLPISRLAWALLSHGSSLFRKHRRPSAD